MCGSSLQAVRLASTLVLDARTRPIFSRLASSVIDGRGSRRAARPAQRQLSRCAPRQIPSRRKTKTMRLAVAGGTGMVGRHVVEHARRAGHDVVVLSRSEGVDVRSGAGLADALRGVDVTNAGTTERGAATGFFTEEADMLQRVGATQGSGTSSPSRSSGSTSRPRATSRPSSSRRTVGWPGSHRAPTIWPAAIGLAPSTGA